MLKLDRLIKILALTSSPEDFEALSAIRTANRMIADAQLTWAQVVSIAPTRASGASHQTEPKPSFYGPSEYADQVVAQRREQLEKMFSSLKAVSLNPKTREFVESLNRQFNFKHSLTPRQYAALKRIHDEHARSV